MTVFIPSGRSFQTICTILSTEAEQLFQVMFRRHPNARLLCLLKILEFHSHNTSHTAGLDTSPSMKWKPSSLSASTLQSREPEVAAVNWAQLPWNTPFAGPLLVVDLRTSLTGLLAALSALGVRGVALSVQQIPHHAHAILHGVLNFVVVQNAECVDDRVFQLCVSQAHVFGNVGRKHCLDSRECSTPKWFKDRFSMFASGTHL